MNYLAHGRLVVGRPYVLAGTAIPDWLNVVDRRVRVRQRAAQPFADDPDTKISELAQGILLHHQDDQWFHRSETFVQACAEMTLVVRASLSRDESMRVGFLGHILVEMLLDAVIAEQQAGLLDDYYNALRQVDADFVRQIVERVSGKSVPQMPKLVRRFCEVQFLKDYAYDTRLLHRLNQVMQRVRLNPLPAKFARIFPAARELVADQYERLLTSPAARFSNSADNKESLPCNTG